MTIKDTNVTIMVNNMDASIAFYEALGFAVKQRWDNHYAQLSATGIVIGLHPNSSNTVTGSGNISIGFTTDNFEDARNVLHSLSIETKERNEEGGQFLHFNDPDGTALYFIKPKY